MKVDIIKRCLHNYNDTLIGGFEVFCLNNTNSEESRQEFIDTIEKIIQFYQKNK